MKIIVDQNGKEYGLCGKKQEKQAQQATGKQPCNMCDNNILISGKCIIGKNRYECYMTNGFYIRVI